MPETLVYDACEQCDENPAFEPSPICAKCHEENEKRTIEIATAPFQARIKELEEKLSLYEYIRPEVLVFAKQMERVLQNNDDKGGWSGCDFSYLFGRLNEEVEELEEAFQFIHENHYSWTTATNPCEKEKHKDAWTHWKLEALKEACDIANFAMMIVDRYKLIPLSQEANKEALKNLTQIGHEMGLYDTPPTQEGDNK